MIHERTSITPVNCLGYAAYSLGLISEERALMPLEYKRYFDFFSKQRVLEVRTSVPENVKAVVVSQNSKEGPFFPIHIVVIDKEDLTQVHHRPRSGSEVTYEPLADMMGRELSLNRELFYLSESAKS